HYLSACREDLQLRTRAQKTISQIDTRSQQVLAVVEDYQQMPALKRARERADQGIARELTHAKDARDCLRHQRAVG
ncbi:MAG TPA: hypothetical protein VK821_02800, partial [Dehalococcoidia bacterium]|nr:hypothetical protein [Dehalococcoidia bacterium]